MGFIHNYGLILLLYLLPLSASIIILMTTHKIDEKRTDTGLDKKNIIKMKKDIYKSKDHILFVYMIFLSCIIDYLFDDGGIVFLFAIAIVLIKYLFIVPMIFIFNKIFKFNNLIELYYTGKKIKISTNIKDDIIIKSSDYEKYKFVLYNVLCLAFFVWLGMEDYFNLTFWLIWIPVQFPLIFLTMLYNKSILLSHEKIKNKIAGYTTNEINWNEVKNIFAYKVPTEVGKVICVSKVDFKEFDNFDYYKELKNKNIISFIYSDETYNCFKQYIAENVKMSIEVFDNKQDSF